MNKNYKTKLFLSLLLCASAATFAGETNPKTRHPRLCTAVKAIILLGTGIYLGVKINQCMMKNFQYCANFLSKNYKYFYKNSEEKLVLVEHVGKNIYNKGATTLTEFKPLG